MIETPYSRIANEIAEWSAKNGYYDMLVSIAIEDDYTHRVRKITEVLEIDLVSLKYHWFSDWWEGEKTVTLIGFAPISSILLIGTPTQKGGMDVYVQ